MCYATKRKIVDCVKQLMRKKEIRKITIQDIMDATGMSRQSFYYHFKDIYDVLEWVECNDFAKRISYEQNQTLESWVVHTFRVLDEERPFFERVVSEIEWPKLLPIIEGPIREQICLILMRYEKVHASGANIDFCANFLTTSYCYYLMDYVYHKKHRSDQEIAHDVQSFLSMLDTRSVLRSVSQASQESRMVG